MDDMNEVTRKKHTGETGNKGEFGSKTNTGDDINLPASPALSEAHSLAVARLPLSDPWRKDTERVGHAGMNMLFEHGDPTAGALVAQVGAAEAFALVTDDRRDTPDGFVGMEALRAQAAETSPDKIAREFSFARQLGVEIATPDDEAWPTGFDDLGRVAPLALWTRGDLTVISDMDKNVTIDGSRVSTPYGDHVTMELSAGVANDGSTIVTNGGYGIAGMAMRTALAAERPTAVISSSGHMTFLPTGNAPAIAKVAEAGVVISESSPSGPSTRATVARRDVLAGAVSAKTVIVEAGIIGRRMRAALATKELGRKVAAVPGPVTSNLSAGTHQLIKDGVATLVMNAEDIRAL